MSYLILGFVVVPVVFIASLPIYSQNISEDTTIADSPGEIRSTDQAIARANLYTGFDSTEGFSDGQVTAFEIDTITNDKTPYFANIINNQRVWKVVYTKVKVGRGSRFTYRDFDVILDPANGNMLSIYSFSDKVGTNNTPPEPDPRFYQKISKNGIVVIIPDTIPKVDFINALRKIVFNPAQVKIIRGIFADFLSETRTKKNTWKIIARGSETIFPLAGDRYGQVPDRYLNSMLHAIDGSTGELLYFTDPPYDEKNLEQNIQK